MQDASTQTSPSGGGGGEVCVETDIISRYIPYKVLMIKTRYISKDWMLFTQKYLQFSNQEKVKIKNEETRYLRVAKVKI